MKTRRHHNNKGYRQIKTGSSERELKRIARRLGIKYGIKKQVTNEKA